MEDKQTSNSREELILNLIENTLKNDTAAAVDAAATLAQNYFKSRVSNVLKKEELF